MGGVVGGEALLKVSLHEVEKIVVTGRFGLIRAVHLLARQGEREAGKGTT